MGKIAIKATSPGGKVIRYFIDPETYLIRKIQRTIENPQGGTTPITEEILEYTTVNGVQLPKKTQTKVGPITITEEIQQYEINIPLEDQIFQPPE